MRRMRLAGTTFAVTGIAVLFVVLATGPAGASTGAKRPPLIRAVVLVSGLDSSSPFSTPAAACSGKEGPSWGIRGGVAPALKAAGFRVFTAPVRKGSLKAPPPACAGPAPGRSAWLDSTGDVDANGAALGRFLAFLRSAYHVDSVTLVGHSDGGLWSRAAIATGAPKPTIEGLVTLGTPYTGSPAADIGSQLSDLVCGSAGAECGTIQKLAGGLVTLLGPTAVEELSSPFLGTWNPRVKIGRCTATAIQGTAIHPAPLPPPQPRLSGYYLPTDGLVGQGSAADRATEALDGTRIPAAPIPRLVNGGAFPAYHTPQLGTPSELNDAAINAAVVKALRRPTAACAGGFAAHSSSTLVLRLRAVRAAGPGGGTLGAAGRGDLVVTAGKSVVACDRTTLTPSPLLPVPILKTFVSGACKRLGASGAALLLHSTSSSVELTVSGSSLTVKALGAPVRMLNAAVRRGSAWVGVALRGGHGRVPAGDRVHLRLTGRTLGGSDVSASAVMSK